MISRPEVTTHLGISWRVSVGRGDSMPALLHGHLASRLSSYTSELNTFCFFLRVYNIANYLHILGMLLCMLTQAYSIHHKKAIVSPICYYFYHGISQPCQGSKFRLSVSPGQVDFPTDNQHFNICCPSDHRFRR